MNNYQIALTHVNFSREYENVLRFDTRSDQRAYFNLNTLFIGAKNVNFNVTNLFKTQLIYKFDSAQNLTELLNANYAIVKDLEHDFYYFYWINNNRQDAGIQLILDCELDIFQTYYINLEFNPCKILKAHLNRWIDSSDPLKVKFNGNVDSKLFEKDYVDLPKRLIKRTKLNLHPDLTSNSKLNKWLDENVEYWQYLYVSNGNWNFYNNNLNSTTVDVKPIYYGNKNTLFVQNDGNSLNGDVSVFAVPVYKKDATGQIMHYNTYTDGGGIVHDLSYRFNPEAIDNLRIYNNDASKFFAVKASITPPFEITSYTENTDYEIVSNNLRIKGSLLYPNKLGSVDFYGTAPENLDSTLQTGIFIVRIQKFTNFEINYTLDDDFEFLKSSIISGTEDKKYNPKLLSADFKTLTLKSGSMSFDYDIQKLNSKNIKLKYFEALTPDVTRGYLRIDTTGIYIAECADNFTGLVFSAENSMTLANGQLAQMLANNKNYYLQAGLSVGQRFINNMLGVGTSASIQAVATNPHPATVGLQGAGAVIGAGFDITNQLLTIDNMRSAPDIIKNSNGNAVFNAAINQFGLYIEEYSALNNELNMANDSMLLTGYSVNLLGKIKDFDNIRARYNFIQAEIAEINGDISEVIHDKFREIFRKGVRFWNANDDHLFEYSQSNYERSLT
ncbi:MAG: hypothetical protein J6T10_21380 [Methanobrevibacter sp.]|nr:hypothetical protein [Methanobrevibacter sp.]